MVLQSNAKGLTAKYAASPIRFFNNPPLGYPAKFFFCSSTEVTSKVAVSGSTSSVSVALANAFYESFTTLTTGAVTLTVIAPGGTVKATVVSDPIPLLPDGPYTFTGLSLEHGDTVAMTGMLSTDLLLWFTRQRFPAFVLFFW
jgi:hypothetical protein